MHIALKRAKDSKEWQLEVTYLLFSRLLKEAE